mmetsp:Transcript_82108/g.254909  ORF Transcript_82108/g.254909 Transcript_82108/m.254909 type:complete len:237 (-) Transcript_82108:211-921(-)
MRPPARGTTGRRPTAAPPRPRAKPCATQLRTPGSPALAASTRRRPLTPSCGFARASIASQLRSWPRRRRHCRPERCGRLPCWRPGRKRTRPLRMPPQPARPLRQRPARRCRSARPQCRSCGWRRARAASCAWPWRRRRPRRSGRSRRGTMRKSGSRSLWSRSRCGRRRRLWRPRPSGSASATTRRSGPRAASGGCSCCSGATSGTCSCCTRRLALWRRRLHGSTPSRSSSRRRRPS